MLAHLIMFKMIKCFYSSCSTFTRKNKKTALTNINFVILIRAFLELKIAVNKVEAQIILYKHFVHLCV